MIHTKCGGTITLESASVGWRTENRLPGGGRQTQAVVPSVTPTEIGRCDKCGLAGIVCEPPK